MRDIAGVPAADIWSGNRVLDELLEMLQKALQFFEKKLLRKFKYLFVLPGIFL